MQQEYFHLKDGARLNVGDIVFYANDTGSNGIYKYQYVGIIHNVFDDTKYHLFISEHLVSTIAISVRHEHRSISYNKIFTSIEGAKTHVSEMRKQDFFNNLI